jgi:DNA-binding Lrp family transcriptional regulator
LSKYTSPGKLAEELISLLRRKRFLKTGIANLRLVSYILVELAPGTAKQAAEAISKIEGVKMAHAVTGPFDVIAYAEVPDLTTLSDLVLAKIQNVKGVQKTQTAVVVTPDIFEPGLSPTRKNKSRKPS